MRLRFAALVLCASATLASAVAAGLSADDDRYLRSTYGLGPESDVLTRMTPAERSRLHDLISSLKTVPAHRDAAVRKSLYDAYARECAAWAQDHAQPCPPAKDAAAEPGKEIADRICNTCHLFGSGLAPSFFRLAGRQHWDASAVAGALQHSHDMVPINLPATERGQLAIYMNSFR
jgi:cytochrome c5